MIKEIEDLKHIGDWVDGKLVCRPDCPSSAHKKDVPDFDLPDVSGESAPAKPRVHQGPDDSTCVSCEG